MATTLPVMCPIGWLVCLVAEVLVAEVRVDSVVDFVLVAVVVGSSPPPWPVPSVAGVLDVAVVRSGAEEAEETEDIGALDGPTEAEAEPPSGGMTVSEGGGTDGADPLSGIDVAVVDPLVSARSPEPGCPHAASVSTTVNAAAARAPRLFLLLST